MGSYTLAFPAGTWSGFPAFPVVVVTPRGAPGFVSVANVGSLAFSANGSFVAEIFLSSAPGAPIDIAFTFNASAPLTAGTSSLPSSGVRRSIVGRPVARSAAPGRKSH